MNFLNLNQQHKIIHWCDQAILYGVYLTVFFIPVSIAFLEVVFWLMFAAWVIRNSLKLYANGQFVALPKTALNHAFLALVAVVFVGLFFSMVPGLSVRKFFGRFLHNILLFYFVVDVINSRGRLCVVMGCLLLSNVLVSVDTLVQILFLPHRDFIHYNALIYGRITGPFRHPNDFGTYLVTILPVFVALAWAKFKVFSLRWCTLMGVVLVVVNMCMLGLTFSRGAWLAFFLSFMFFAILLRNWRFCVVFILGILLFIGAFYPLMTKSRSDIIAPKDNTVLVSDVAADDDNKKLITMESRKDYYWKVAINVIKRYPILGCGYNAYIDTIKKLKTPPYEYPHNMFLHMAAETGLVGLGAFLWLLICLYKTVLSAPISIKAEDARVLLLGLTVGFTAFIIHSCFDTGFTSVQLSALFWVVVGVAYAVTNISWIESKNSVS